MRPSAILWAYWREVLVIEETAVLLPPLLVVLALTGCAGQIRPMRAMFIPPLDGLTPAAAPVKIAPVEGKI